MFGNKRWAAAVIAAGLLIGCGRDESAESKSAEHEHGHSTPAPGGGHEGHEGHKMPEAAPGATAGHQHGTAHQGHPVPEAGSAVDHSAMGHGARRPDSSGQHAGHGAPAPSAGSQPAAAGHDHAGPSQPAQPAAPSQTVIQEKASAPAPEAPSTGQPAKILSPDALDSPAETSVLDAQRSEDMAKEDGEHAGHGGTYTHVDVGREATAPAVEPHQHVVYACPVHPEVTSSSPGTCSKCGMTLVERREE
ncbi:MAG TPA: heavy metal-binding domain-containing protein, partial [Thermoanaerobaculia bacterium]|nr:heavy metal-binding domain-containing protein [Thermoanaerobaculia bacterium]